MGKKSRKVKKKTSGGGGGGKSKTSSTSTTNNKISRAEDLDKQCDVRKAELLNAKLKAKGKKLRFSVGDRVECGMHTQSDDDIEDFDFGSLSIQDMLSQAMGGSGLFQMSYKPGTVVDLWICNPGEKHKAYPYQVRLDEGQLIYAGRDSDSAIRKSDILPPVANPRDLVLFAQPPHREDCSICMLPLPPYLTRQTKYFSCCGKVICVGCIVAACYAGLNDLCPFCRAPEATTKEGDDKRIQARIKANDPEAMVWSACKLNKSSRPQDIHKSNELMMKAAELGLDSAHFNMGCAYSNGDNGIARDSGKARFHLEKAAVAGHGGARYNLGIDLLEEGEDDQATKHFIVAAKSGYKTSFNEVKQRFAHGWVSKPEFEDTLRLHKESLEEMRSDQRDKAAALHPYTPPTGPRRSRS